MKTPGADGTPSIDEMLVATGQLKQEDVARVRHQQLAHKTEFADAAVELGLVSTDDVRLAIARQYQSRTLSAQIAGMSPELVCAMQPDHPVASAIYRIRTALLLGHKNKSGTLKIAIVGAERGEGRTLLAANLAIAFAQLNARTVLIDADMREGRLHTLFHLPNEGGLARALVQHGEFTGATLVDGFGPLAVMTAGFAPRPEQLLSMSRLHLVMERLSQETDVVIVDTPAWSIGADARVIAAEAGMALLVTRMHAASKSNLLELANALAQDGTVMLAVPFD
ncbi:hypothetical protein BH10PSE17_BH10PSE17_05670 [soil metagenome]